MLKLRAIVIGSGISGCTAARLLKDAGFEVVIYEKRAHIGGNCYDGFQDGVRIHTYGPHLFHTNDVGVWRFLSRFTTWNNYVHKVVADTALGTISIPYNKKTEMQVGSRLSDDEIRQLIFKQYSEKQWGMPWEELPPAIVGRVPFRREEYDDRYFTDQFQGQPEYGYKEMFEAMIEGIEVNTSCDLIGKQIWETVKADVVIYTGMIDAYFNYCFGKLPYRSLRFSHRKTDAKMLHPIVNQCNSNEYTRVYDHSWVSPRETGCGSIVTREYPMAHNSDTEPYYPMPFGRGAEMYKKYGELAKQEDKTVFIGRLATYKYLDMWMAVAQTQKKVDCFLTEFRR